MLSVLVQVEHGIWAEGTHLHPWGLQVHPWLVIGCRSVPSHPASNRDNIMTLTCWNSQHIQCCSCQLLISGHTQETTIYTPQLVLLMPFHAMAQVVSHQPLSAEAWVKHQAILRGNCGQSGTEAGLALSTAVFPCQ